MNKATICLTLLFSLHYSAAYAQEKEKAQKSLIPICTMGIKKACGLIDYSPRWKAPAKYTSLEHLSGAWIANKFAGDLKWSEILNANGEKIAVFSYARKVSDDLFAAIKFNDTMFGLYRHDGTEIISPRFTEIEKFKNNHAIARDQKGNAGLIDLTGNWIIPAQFKSIDVFSEGLAGAQDTSGLYGYIDSKGKWIIEPIYQNVNPFHDGVATVTTPEMRYALNASESILIDKTGNIITPYRPDHAYLWMENKTWVVVRYSSSGYVARMDKINNRGEIIEKDIANTLTRDSDAKSMAEEKEHKASLELLISRLTKSKFPPATESSHWISNPWVSDGLGTGELISTQKITTKKELPNLFWLNARPNDGFELGNLINSVLTDENGKWLLKYRLVNAVEGQDCGSLISIITDRKGRTLWPVNPLQLCQAMNPQLRKQNPLAQEIIVNQENIDRQEEQNVLSEFQPDHFWRKAPITISLADIASFEIPAGYRFLPVKDIALLSADFSEKHKDYIKNDSDNIFIGLIRPEKEWWTAVIRLDKHAAINQVSLEKFDSDGLLTTLESRLTKKNGYQKPLQWIVRPEWNKNQHRLTWAIKSQENFARYKNVSSVKFGEQWMARLQLINKTNYYPLHTDFSYIANQFNSLQEAINFAPAHEYKDKKTTTGWQPSTLITNVTFDTKTETDGEKLQIYSGNADHRTFVTAAEKTIRNINFREKNQRSRKINGLVVIVLVLMPSVIVALYYRNRPKEEEENH